MKPVLVLYATTEGWTGRVSERIAARLAGAGIPCEVHRVTALPPDFGFQDAAGVVIAGSLHLGRYQKELARFVKAHAGELSHLPGAFVSVSLSEATIHRPGSTPAAKEKAAVDIRRCREAFFEETGWHPDRSTSVAGALLYTKYGFLVRLVMKHFAAQSGGSQDTSRDHEYTDWDALDAWTIELASSFGERGPAHPPALAAQEGRAGAAPPA
jgi:menaquinone-dependent protoporphyrinogen oxidase